MFNIVKKLSVMALFLLVTTHSFADVSDAATASGPPGHAKEVRSFLQQIVDVNLRYKDRFHSILDEGTLTKQTPYVTLILCSDSRVDSDIVSESPIGELFVIRNIGNQIQTAFGSVEYGVRDLKTEVLLIIGHSQCGAIKAAMGNYSELPSPIKEELNTLHVNKQLSLNQNIVNNVNNQVKEAMHIFANKVKNQQLVVIGMVYDMHNEFNFGSGQLILVNINNQTTLKALAEHQYIKDIQNIVILGGPH